MANSSISALVADPSSAVRLTLRQILQGIDVDRVDVATSIAEARRKLMEGRFDIVLCEYNFNTEETGQDLLEELRAKNILPISTIFVVVTAERSYARVVGVAEEAPDEYLLKPVNAGDLAERIEKAFARRDALMEVYEAMRVHKEDLALKHARHIMTSRPAYMQDAARLAAQILHRLGRFEEAMKLYTALLAKRDLAWAKLGLAKVATLQGDHEAAEKAMCDIIGSHALYLPVYNQLAALYVSQERFADALNITEQAIRITPNSLKRLQLAGQLSYSMGDTAKAADYLGRATRVNGNSVALDYRSLFHLILIHFDSGHPSDAASLVKQMQAKVRAEPGIQRNPRGEWYVELALAVESMCKREPLSAIDRLQKLAKFWQEPQFDFDLLIDYLTIVNRLYTNDIGSTLAGWIEAMVYRFNVSRQAQELMVARVEKRDRLVAVINEAGEFISKTTSAAAKNLLDEHFEAAADALIEESQRLRNNRLLLAAANAAAKCVQKLGLTHYRASAETCLSLMQPPADAAVERRIKASMEGLA